ncbi:MAG: alpha/beta hydrolase [Acidobacteria bacterium]|nr:alpha/beta hydrolase [Acidobacteriota bacterium]
MSRFAVPVLLFGAAALLQAEAPHQNIPLWEAGKVPGAVGGGPLHEPFLTAFLPPKKERNGSAVIIAPGGSNIMLMYGVEGIELAERFNDWGTAAFVLTYRLEPKYKQEARSADGHRAVRLLRTRAAEWKIDPERILLAGFSAGGHLVRSAMLGAGPGDPAAADPLDRLNSKPNVLCMVYGPGVPSPDDKLKDYPPTFLLSAAWDRGAAEGTVKLYSDINKAGGVAELHIYQRGRHGFGAATTSPEYGPWMDSLKHFLGLNGFFGGNKK